MKPSPSPKCILHPERSGLESLNIPCAPGGKLWLCRECADRYAVTPEAVLKETFLAYKGKSPARIEAFKTPGNPNN